ncbi:MAG: hypothetical protein HY747_02255 [Elusimicrobia bacterium]|nr:hypothetical protein [Elusimicrobiota bacterium]
MQKLWLKPQALQSETFHLSLKHMAMKLTESSQFQKRRPPANVDERLPSPAGGAKPSAALGAIARPQQDRPDGKLFAVFTSTHFGGFETIQAHVTDTPAVSTSAALNVRVPGLEEMQPSFRYNLTGAPPATTHTTNPKCPGKEIMHFRNHFGTPGTIAVLLSIILVYEDILFDLEDLETPPHKLGINDMSLPRGGLFDICSDWQIPHRGHRRGTSVDIDRNGEVLVEPGRFVPILLKKFDDDIIKPKFPEVKKEKEVTLHYEFPQ